MADKMLLRGVVDITSPTVDLSRLVLFLDSGSATITGFFVGEAGEQIGDISYTGTIDTEPRTLVGGASNSVRVFSGVTALPTGAVGFRGTLDADVRISTGANLLNTPPIPTALRTDLVTYPTRYPKLALGDDIRLGRV